MDDLIIVGGGPVGLGAAICAALAGRTARVLEAKPGVIDKACGEGLMPGGVQAMASLGIEVPEYRPFRGIRYVEGDRQADGHFRSGHGRGIRRTVLHKAMRDRALSLGIPIEECRVGEVQQDEAGVSAGGFRGRYLIAADGLRSTVRRQYGLQIPQKSPPRYGLRRHFAVKPWSDYVEVHWSPLAEAYVTPVAEDLVGIALLFSDDLRRQFKGGGETFYHSVLQELFPHLHARCRNACTEVMGAGHFKTVLSSRVRGRVLFAGDAAGYLDPLTGEGVRLGLATAEAAVAAVLSGDPAAYDRRWQRMTRRYWMATSAILALRRREVLRRRVIPLLARAPWIFDHLLSALDHAGGSAWPDQRSRSSDLQEGEG